MDFRGGALLGFISQGLLEGGSRRVCAPLPKERLVKILGTEVRGRKSKDTGGFEQSSGEEVC